MKIEIFALTQDFKLCYRSDNTGFALHFTEEEQGTLVIFPDVSRLPSHLINLRLIVYLARMLVIFTILQLIWNSSSIK